VKVTSFIAGARSHCDATLPVDSDPESSVWHDRYGPQGHGRAQRHPRHILQ